MKVACTVQVTAGVTVRSGRMAPARANAVSRGVCGPKCRGVSPTTSRTMVGRMCARRGKRPAVDTAQSHGDDQAKFVPMRDQGARMAVATTQGLSFATLLKLGRV